MLNTPEVIKEAFTRPEFSGRPGKVIIFSLLISDDKNKTNLQNSYVWFSENILCSINKQTLGIFLKWWNSIILSFLKELKLTCLHFLGNFSGTFFQKGRTGITTTEGAHWKSQRKFLKEYIDKVTSTSTQGFQDLMMDEVNDLKTDLNKKLNEPMAVSYKLNVCIINILWNLTCGRRLHAQQQEFQTVYECVDKITQFMGR